MGSKKKRSKKEQPTPPEPNNDDALADEGEDLTEQLLERLPHLAKEMKSSTSDVLIEGVRWEETNRTQQSITTDKPRFSGHSPDVIDFLRRCTTDEEAMQIINFLEKRGEISSIHAKELRRQLQTQGVRSFGSRKSWGYYERES
ncbi:MAG: DUF2095 family protein [Candidatus Hermodarchaeota archaeon]